MLIINAVDPFASQGPCLLFKTVTHWYGLSLVDERGPKTIALCDAMRTDPAAPLKFLWSTGVDSQALRATKPLACSNRLCHLFGGAEVDIATNTIVIWSRFAWLFLCCGIWVFAYLHSATAAQSLWITQLIRRLVESPALGTDCLEQPAAHSLTIILPEQRMHICITRLDYACAA